MRQLVRLRTRPSRDGRAFAYLLDYVDENGERKRISLGHSDRRKAERQRVQKERELRMGVVAPLSMKLSEFWADCWQRTEGQVRESTLAEQDTAMRQLIETIGNVDYQRVQHKHGERFMQVLLDGGNSPATAYKKISALRRVFQLSVLRGQLEENPFRHLRRPRIPQQEVHVYSDEECHRLLKAARETSGEGTINWELLIALALCTAMRRGELLNTVWCDIDFDRQTVSVSPKKDSDTTWLWYIKDSEGRKLPLTDEVFHLLLRHHENQPEGYIYLFVPRARYDRIQGIRQQNRWTTQHGKCPVNNFNRQFNLLRCRAGIERGEFHDLRRTCLTRWFENGLTEYDVMKLAGHSDFDTTHRFYLAIRRDLLERARSATAAAMSNDFGAHLARAPSGDSR